MHELNLLSSEQKTYLKTVKLQYLIRYVWFQVFSLLLIIAVVLFFSYQILDNNLHSLETNLASEKKFFESENIGSLEDLIKQLNIQLSEASQIQKKYIKWTDKVGAFSALIPDGIRLTEFSFNTKENTITLTGTAERREHLLDLQSALEADSNFSEIETPISNLIQKENISFSLTGNIDPAFYD